MYTIFENSNLVGIMKYDPSNLVKSLGKMKIAEEGRWLHSLFE